MKKYLFNAIILLSAISNAQVGINTENPNSSFEVAKTNSAAKIDGVIVPKLTKLELNQKSYQTSNDSNGHEIPYYGESQLSALVFVTDTTLSADITQKPQVNDITSTGFYFYNGTKWVKLDQSLSKWDTSGNLLKPHEYLTVNELNPNFTIKNPIGRIKSGEFLGTTNDVDIAFKRNNEYVGLINTNNISFGKEAFMARFNTKTDGTSTTPFNSNIIAIGSEALKLNNGGSNNIAIGGSTLSTNIIGTNNIGIGYNSLYRSIHSQNVSIGINSSMLLESGSSNTVYGFAALRNVSTGTSNVAIGDFAMTGFQPKSATNKGSFNVAIGSNALNNPYVTNNEFVQFNTAIGNFSGINVRGNNNIFIGNKATFNTFNGAALDPDKTTDGVSNDILIKNISNAMNIGNIIFGIDVTKSPENYTNSTAKIGIGAYPPEARLHVKGINNGEVLKLENLQEGNGRVLVIDSNGFVRKSSSMSARQNQDDRIDELYEIIQTLQNKIQALEEQLTQ